MSDSAYPAVHAAILAAGPSTRFGSPKQLVRLAGTPVLHEAIANAAMVAGHSVTVVLGAHASEVGPALRQSAVAVVVNRDWEEGLASSIRTAVGDERPRPRGGLFASGAPIAREADEHLPGFGER